MSTHLRPRTGTASSPVRPTTAYSTCSTIRRVTPSPDSLDRSSSMKSIHMAYSTPQRPQSSAGEVARPWSPTRVLTAEAVPGPTTYPHAPGGSAARKPGIDSRNATFCQARDALSYDNRAAAFKRAELMRKYGHLSVKELTRVLSERNRAVLDEYNRTHTPIDPSCLSQKGHKNKAGHIRQTPQHERGATQASTPCPDFVFPFRSGEAPSSPEKTASDSARSTPSPIRGADQDPDSDPSTLPVTKLGSNRNRNSLRITIPPPRHPAYGTGSDTPKIAVHGPLLETPERETRGWGRVAQLGVAGGKKRVHGMKKRKRTEKKENGEAGCGCGCTIM
ncbi:hypothetical protein K505DRAFT_419440 [Melanomma pulvis-pyrius CBS 109.77]|uniref:Uncharacterized protein n=1 Tax=Melanomma pulvis-pyrius CBS 109.77 TaxID=1314802 RepID=A0A6A6X4G3_9PLEO|nr:hypothetical protein K505DRAFT_419440 [Melanomma pulvis-pyrius CBS 109.77]